jgi:hypothetical protein
MKKKLLIFFVILIPLSLFCQDAFFNEVDNLNNNANYNEALKLLEQKFNENKNDIKIAWRIVQVYYFLSEPVTNKNDKIALYSKGIQVAEPFLDKQFPDKKDMANLLYWYTINYASKTRDLGIFAGRESLDLIPRVIKLSNKCTEIDPEFAGAYFFRGKFYDEIPAFLGGSKMKMETNYALSLKYANPSERILFLYEISNSLSKRKWSLTNKLNEAKNKKAEVNQLLSSDKDDLTLANLFLKEIINTLEKKDKLFPREEKLLKSARDLLKSIS